MHIFAFRSTVDPDLLAGTAFKGVLKGCSTQLGCHPGAQDTVSGCNSAIEGLESSFNHVIITTYTPYKSSPQRNLHSKAVFPAAPHGWCFHTCIKAFQAGTFYPPNPHSTHRRGKKLGHFNRYKFNLHHCMQKSTRKGNAWDSIKLCPVLNFCVRYGPT